MYQIRFRPEAMQDITQLRDYIHTECAAPLTAARQFQDLGKRLDWLEQFAESLAIDFDLSYKYGMLVRHISFGKKMTILYTVEEGVVYVLRIMPQSMIIY